MLYSSCFLTPYRDLESVNKKRNKEACITSDLLPRLPTILSRIKKNKQNFFLSGGRRDLENYYETEYFPPPHNAFLSTICVIYLAPEWSLGQKQRLSLLRKREFTKQG